MAIVTDRIRVATRGNEHFEDITPRLRQSLESSHVRDGVMTVFVSGSTAGITTFEFEPGLIKDLKEFYEKIAPSKVGYHHDETWGDANGFSHVRATLTGPSLVIPFEEGELLLGRWQQVVLVEFDTRPRTRDVVVHIMGE